MKYSFSLTATVIVLFLSCQGQIQKITSKNATLASKDTLFFVGQTKAQFTKTLSFDTSYTDTVIVNHFADDSIAMRYSYEWLIFSTKEAPIYKSHIHTTFEQNNDNIYISNLTAEIATDADTFLVYKDSLKLNISSTFEKNKFYNSHFVGKRVSYGDFFKKIK